MRLGTSSPLAHTTPEDWAQRQQSLGLQAVNFHLTYGTTPPSSTQQSPRRRRTA